MMNSETIHDKLAIGIDVGGKKKGFHAVALKGMAILDTVTHTSPSIIMEWCLGHSAEVIAVDAPCGWSNDRGSRQAERDLAGMGISCFSTPMRKIAIQRAFYNWVFNGQLLYEEILTHYPLFYGEKAEGIYCIETFPHAVVCALRGEIVSARPKALRRRQLLIDLELSGIEKLRNIDFLDAALCAVTADHFRKGTYNRYGNVDEGFIVTPKVN